jgi:hypothetical protein
MTYRNKNLFTFIYSQGISILAWIMFVFAGGLAFGIGALEIQDHFPIISPILFVGILSIYALFGALNFIVYKRGKDLVIEIEEDIIEIIENQKVTVHNYNKFHFQISLSTFIFNTDYNFDKADILLTDNSMILLGYGIPIGLMEGYANPIEILFHGNPRIPNYAKLIDKPIIEQTNIELKIEDRYYEKNLTIKINSNEKLRQWLTHA